MPKFLVKNRSLDARLFVPLRRQRGWLEKTICNPWVAVPAVLAARLASAQEALHNSIVGQVSASERFNQPESQSYTFKSGDFRVLLTPSVAMDWNDNINTAETNAQSAFILQPAMQIGMFYPISDRNVLNLNLGVGYYDYLEHSKLSTWFLQSGSQLSFDVFVKDVQFNLHDRISFMQDSAQDASIAGTAQSALLNNTSGLQFTWPLKHISLSLGYDHSIISSGNSQFASQDNNSELFNAQVSTDIFRRMTVGIESTATFVRYDQAILNNNNAYTVGLFGDWKVSSAFEIQPRAGYTITQIQQTSATIQTSDIGSWYADLAITHKPNDVINYTIDAGHEVRAGLQGADATEDFYVRPSITWYIIRDTQLQTSFSYENGKQGEGNISGNLTENYSWETAQLTISHQLTSRFSLSMSYRYTTRSSSIVGRAYNQDLADFSVSYRIP